MKEYLQFGTIFGMEGMFGLRIVCRYLFAMLYLIERLS